MQARSFSDMECPIAQALEQIGQWWSLLIIRDVLLGFRFFGELERRLGITPTTLTKRLDALVQHGILERRRASEHPPRDEFVLTPKGKDLFELVVLIGGWSNRWIAGEGRAHLEFVDAETGEPVDAELFDRRTGKPIRLGSVRLAPGPRASSVLKRQMQGRFGATTKARGQRS